LIGFEGGSDSEFVPLNEPLWYGIETSSHVKTSMEGRTFYNGWELAVGITAGNFEHSV
jgi:hypothetical protein